MPLSVWGPPSEVGLLGWRRLGAAAVSVRWAGQARQRLSQDGEEQGRRPEEDS